MTLGLSLDVFPLYAMKVPSQQAEDEREDGLASPSRIALVAVPLFANYSRNVAARGRGHFSSAVAFTVAELGLACRVGGNP